MLEVARCLTLAVPRPVEHIGSWYQADIDHPLVGGGVGGWGGQPIRSGHQVRVDPEDIDADDLKSIIDAYFRLGTGGRRRLRLVLDRLNAAKLPRRLEDRAVDLGVSIEALLFSGKDAAEISMKFKMRGTILATADVTRRKAVFNLLDDIYTMRSISAHGETLQGDVSSLNQRLEDGIALAAQLIQNALALGRIPDCGVTPATTYRPRNGSVTASPPSKNDASAGQRRRNLRNPICSDQHISGHENQHRDDGHHAAVPACDAAGVSWAARQAPTAGRR